MLSMTIFNGSPALIDKNGHILLSNIRVGVEYQGNTYNQLFCQNEGNWTQIGSNTEGILQCSNASITYCSEKNGIVLRTSYTHTGQRIKAGQRFYSLIGLWHCGFERCLYNSPTTYDNGTDFNEMQSLIHTAVLTDGQRITSSENVALIDHQDNHIIAGYISFDEYFSNLQIGSEGLFSAWGQLENSPVEPNTCITGDQLYIGLCDDVRWGLIDYAKIAAEHTNSRAGQLETPYGYCTWYYYGEGVKSQDVYENLNMFALNNDRLKIKYFNIDSGWYQTWGDWIENEKFSCSMKKIADDIKAEGYLPGIWLAPFGSNRSSNLYKAHPDWFVQSYDNNPSTAIEGKLGNYLSLDMSHPEVKTWMHELYHKISYEWGYRHIKIDIITPCLLPGRYYDPSYNTLKNYREGLRLIREAITDDTFLLGCTAPMGGAIGYVDGMRTSQDIFENWDCLLPMFNQNLKRYYYNNIWFSNDPDCLLVRTAANEDDDCIRQCTRTNSENRTFATALMAAGGAMIMSDKMPRLEEYQLELLRKMFPINTQAAIPLDLMESEVPGILDLGRRKNTHIFALINWTDARKNMSLNIGSGHVFEFWSQKYLKKMQGVKCFEVEPHEAKILFVTDDAPIAVIGTDDCMCPTLLQSYENGILTGEFIKPKETLWIAASSPIKAEYGCTLELVTNGLYRAYQNGNTFSFRIIEA